MSVRVETPSFEDWVVHAFDHEVRSPEWYFDLDAAECNVSAEVTVAYLTRLFRSALTYLDRYDARQLNQGLWYIADGSGGGHMLALTDKSVPLAERIHCVESFSSLFEDLFALRCSEHLIHLMVPSGAPHPEPNPLNLVCYMWWDIMPWEGAPKDALRHEFDAAALGVMERTLSLESSACRESALHGLGHWQRYYPDRVAEIIDRALLGSRNWPEELHTYARNAKGGCVL